MKILFSLTYYTPYVSGLTMYVKRLAEALIRQNYQVSVLTMRFDKKLQLHEIVQGVQVIRAEPFYKISKGFISIDWLIKSWHEVRFSDMVIVNLPQFEGIVQALYGKMFGKKVISIYHCEVVLPNGILNKIVENFLNLSNYLTLLLSDQVITYTEDFAKNSKVLPFFKSKISYIYPPIIEPKIDNRVQKILSDKIGSKPKFIIGLAARLAAEKGMEYLLESIPILKSKVKSQKSKLQFKIQKFKIVIAGPLEPVGERDYKEKILKLVEKYKDYVVFLGELKEEEMGSFYSLLDVLVLPSINSTEAFGMVQVEAMLLGVPCVSSDLPGVRIPIQQTGMGIIVPIKNSQKLAEAIVEVLLNKNKYIKNKEFIRKEFSFEKTIVFYQKLLC